MSICPCGYWWADLDDEGRPITNEYCHYHGPAEWAPCEINAYYDELEAEEAEVRAEAEAAAEEYEAWLMEQVIVDEEEPTFEEYGAPYDYQEF